MSSDGLPFYMLDSLVFKWHSIADEFKSKADKLYGRIQSSNMLGNSTEYSFIPQFPQLKIFNEHSVLVFNHLTGGLKIISMVAVILIIVSFLSNPMKLL